MTEAELTKTIIDALNTHPHVHVWRNNVGRRGRVSFGLKGSCDITGIVIGGMRVELEVKLPKNNNFEPDQLPFMARMGKFGALVGVVRSVDDAWAIVLPAIQAQSQQRSRS